MGLTSLADVDWYYVWWNSDCLPYGIPDQDGYLHRGCSCDHNFMAVRITQLTLNNAASALTAYSRNTPFTYFPNTPTGDSKFAFFKNVIAFHPIKSILASMDWNLAGANGPQLALAMFTLLYVDIIDTTATLYSMARFSGVVDPETGDFPRSTIAYCTDAITISIGAVLGTSPVSAYVESGAGISEGGRTGLTSITTGLCFLVSIFFAPIFASIPPWATGCALVLVCSFFFQQTQKLD